MDAWFSDDEEELADLGELDNSRSLPSLQVSGLRIPPTLGPQRHEPDSTLHRPSPPTPLLQDLLSASESQERGAREFTFPVIRDDVSESDSDTGPAAPVFSSIDYAADTNPDGSSRLSTSRASTRGGASPLKVTFDAALDLDAHMSQSPMRVATPGVKTTNPNPSTHRAVSYHPPTATTTTTAATTSDSGSVYVPGPALDADGLAPSRAVIDETISSVARRATAYVKGTLEAPTYKSSGSTPEVGAPPPTKGGVTPGGVIYTFDPHYDPNGAEGDEELSAVGPSLSRSNAPVTSVSTGTGPMTDSDEDERPAWQRHGSPPHVHGGMTLRQMRSGPHGPRGIPPVTRPHGPPAGFPPAKLKWATDAGSSDNDSQEEEEEDPSFGRGWLGGAAGRLLRGGADSHERAAQVAQVKLAVRTEAEQVHELRAAEDAYAAVVAADGSDVEVSVDDLPAAQTQDLEMGLKHLDAAVDALLYRLENGGVLFAERTTRSGFLPPADTLWSDSDSEMLIDGDVVDGVPLAVRRHQRRLAADEAAKDSTTYTTTATATAATTSTTTATATASGTTDHRVEHSGSSDSAVKASPSSTARATNHMDMLRAAQARAAAWRRDVEDAQQGIIELPEPDQEWETDEDAPGVARAPVVPSNTSTSSTTATTNIDNGAERPTGTSTLGRLFKKQGAGIEFAMMDLVRDVSKSEKAKAERAQQATNTATTATARLSDAAGAPRPPLGGRMKMGMIWARSGSDSDSESEYDSDSDSAPRAASDSAPIAASTSIFDARDKDDDDEVVAEEGAKTATTMTPASSQVEEDGPVRWEDVRSNLLPPQYQPSTHTGPVAPWVTQSGQGVTERGSGGGGAEELAAFEAEEARRQAEEEKRIRAQAQKDAHARWKADQEKHKREEAERVAAEERQHLEDARHQKAMAAQALQMRARHVRGWTSGVQKLLEKRPGAVPMLDDPISFLPKDAAPATLPRDLVSEASSDASSSTSTSNARVVSLAVPMWHRDHLAEVTRDVLKAVRTFGCGTLQVRGMVLARSEVNEDGFPDENGDVVDVDTVLHVAVEGANNLDASFDLESAARFSVTPGLSTAFTGRLAPWVAAPGHGYLSSGSEWAVTALAWNTSTSSSAADASLDLHLLLDGAARAGLEVVGLRTLYAPVKSLPTDAVGGRGSSLVLDRALTGDGHAMVVVAVRGVKAAARWRTALGPSSLEAARMSDPDSVHARLPRERSHSPYRTVTAEPAVHRELAALFSTVVDVRTDPATWYQESRSHNKAAPPARTVGGGGLLARKRAQMATAMTVASTASSASLFAALVPSAVGRVTLLFPRVELAAAHAVLSVLGKRGFHLVSVAQGLVPAAEAGVTALVIDPITSVLTPAAWPAPSAMCLCAVVEMEGAATWVLSGLQAALVEEAKAKAKTTRILVVGNVQSQTLAKVPRVISDLFVRRPSAMDVAQLEKEVNALSSSGSSTSESLKHAIEVAVVVVAGGAEAVGDILHAVDLARDAATRDVLGPLEVVGLQWEAGGYKGAVRKHVAPVLDDHAGPEALVGRTAVQRARIEAARTAMHGPLLLAAVVGVAAHHDLHAALARRWDDLTKSTAPDIASRLLGVTRDRPAGVSLAREIFGASDVTLTGWSLALAGGPVENAACLVRLGGKSGGAVAAARVLRGLFRERYRLAWCGVRTAVDAGAPVSVGSVLGLVVERQSAVVGLNGLSASGMHRGREGWSAESDKAACAGRDQAEAREMALGLTGSASSIKKKGKMEEDGMERCVVASRVAEEDFVPGVNGGLSLSDVAEVLHVFGGDGYHLVEAKLVMVPSRAGRVGRELVGGGKEDETSCLVLVWQRPHAYARLANSLGKLDAGVARHCVGTTGTEETDAFLQCVL